MLDKFWKIFPTAALVGISFGAGWYVRKPEVVEKEKIVEKIVEKEKAVTHTVVKRVKEPNGTVTTTTVADTQTVKDEAQFTTIYDEKTVEGPKYSLAIDFEASKWPPAPSYRVTLGYRALGPVWLQASFNPNLHSVGIGARLEL